MFRDVPHPRLIPGVANMKHGCAARIAELALIAAASCLYRGNTPGTTLFAPELF